MKSFIKKLLITALILVFTVNVSYCKDLMKTIGNINHDFTMSELSEYVYLDISDEIVANDEIIIPENSTLKLKTICAIQERRWHKSGYILTKLESFSDEDSQDYDMSENNIYLAVRKYEPINKKDAAILTTELILLSGASFYAPGVDVAYFFTKGAILRKKHPNWFKAGVSNAYDNSIFWFWLKGKPIELKKDSQIKIQSVKEEKIKKLTTKINKYNEKQEFKSLKKQNKNFKKELKQAQNSENYTEKEAKKLQKEISEEENETVSENNQEIAEKNEKNLYKAEKDQYKKYKKDFKKIIKKQKEKEDTYLKKAEKKYFKNAKKQAEKEKKNLENVLKVKKHMEESSSLDENR